MTLLAFLAGLILGSFLNVCIHRWPLEESVVAPRSRCPQCKSPISWRDNIPVFSYILLHGRCRHCGEPISKRYPIVELLTGALFAGLFHKYGLQPFTYKCALFTAMMIVLVATDFEQYILPDEITLGGLAIGLALSPFILIPAGGTQLIWLLTGVSPAPWQQSLAESAFGAVFFGGMLWALREIYYRVRGVDGLGFGDVKMVAMMGAFWGVVDTMMMLIIGSVLGAVIGAAIVLLGGKKWTHELPYGSYLGAAAIIVVLWGDALLGAYWSALREAAGG